MVDLIRRLQSICLEEDLFVQSSSPDWTKTRFPLCPLCLCGENGSGFCCAVSEGQSPFVQSSSPDWTKTRPLCALCASVVRMSCSCNGESR